MNQITEKPHYKKIRSKYMLEKIFSFLSQKKTLYIIKYNKSVQKLLNMKLKNYVDFSDQIEIVLKFKNELRSNKNYFINIINKDERPFFHFFYYNKKKKLILIYLDMKK